MGVSEFGGLIRDVRVYFKNIGFSNILHADIVALCYIISYTDLKHMLKLVQSVHITTHHFDDEICVIRQYMAKD